MHCELIVSDLNLTTDEVVKQAFAAFSYPINGVSVGQAFLPVIRDVIYPHEKFNIGTTVDYQGFSCQNVRNHAVLSACRRGANVVDLFVSTRFLADGKYYELMKELQSNLEICRGYGAELRIVVDYHYFPEKILGRVSKIAMEIGVSKLIISGCGLPDEIVDNLILAHNLEQQTGIKTLINTNFWKDSAWRLVEKSDVFGVRVSEFTLLSKIIKIGV